MSKREELGQLIATEVQPLQPKTEEELVFKPQMVEAIYAAWHGAGVDIAGGNWERFVGMLPRA